MGLGGPRVPGALSQRVRDPLVPLHARRSVFRSGVKGKRIKSYLFHGEDYSYRSKT
jgi:hypothetical protein